MPSVLDSLTSGFSNLGLAGMSNDIPAYSMTTTNAAPQQPASQSGINTNPNSVIQQNSTNLTVMQYPLENIPYNIGFQFATYSRASAIAPPTSTINGSVFLPIPANLLDYNHQKYEETQLGAIGATVDNFLKKGGSASDVFGGVAAGATSSILSLIPGTLAAAAAQATTAAGAIGSSIAASAASAVGQQIALTSGIAANPNLALFYVSPTFKKFEFVWKFSPRNANESNVIRQIISYFHQCMSPGILGAGVFYTYPNIVTPQFLTNGQNLDYLFRFKPCVITDCGVNYAPSGVPSFFAGTRAPTEIDFKIVLTELSVWTQQDYQTEATQDGLGQIVGNSS